MKREGELPVISVQVDEALSLEEALAASYSLLLKNAAQMALDYTGSREHVEAAVVLTGDDQLHELNRQFLGVDASTDVLAFPAGEIDPDTQNTNLGDVLISYGRAQAQAEAGGHPVEAELQLLAVHGVLHLLGYDHANPEEKAAMWAAQAGILARLGSAVAGPPF